MTAPRLISVGFDPASVRQAIGQAASSTGIDFSYLYAQAKSESGLNPTAQASNSSASGLFQFIDQSWLGIVKQHGADHGMGWAADAITRSASGRWQVDPAQHDAVFALRDQAGPAAAMAAEYASDNADGLAKTLGRAANGTDLYFAHFLGLSKAQKFLDRAADDPDTSAAALFPREAQANRGIFYTRSGQARTLGQVYALMGDRLAEAGMATATAPSEPPAPPALLYADAAIAEPPAAPDTATALAALDANRINVLRPTPATARLAYLMLTGAALG